MMQIADYGKKGQIKMQQTAFMLIALTVFFVLVGLFFLSYSLSGLKQAKSSANANEAQQLAARIANSPELSCGSAFGTTAVSCVDFDKLMSLQKYSAEYENFWGAGGLDVMIVYPANKTKIDCTEENFPNCNYANVFGGNESGFDESNYVSLCRWASSGNSVYTNCTLAKLMVRYNNA